MSRLETAVRNGLIAALVAGLVAGLVSRSAKTGLKAALFSGTASCLGSYFIAGSVEPDGPPEDPVA